LLLTLAVTIIEVALIATIMLGEKPVPTLARDTVFAVVMIVCNGLVGVCILAGGLRYREQDVQVTDPTSISACDRARDHHADHAQLYPDHPGPVYSAVQLGFVSVVTLILYGVFLYTQTIRHRDYFISETAGVADDGCMLRTGPSCQRPAATGFAAGRGAAAKKFSLVVDAGAALIGAPPAFAVFWWRC